jgi:hypothetical protein
MLSYMRLISYHITIRRHNPEDRDVYLHRRENLKSTPFLLPVSVSLLRVPEYIITIISTGRINCAGLGLIACYQTLHYWVQQKGKGKSCPCAFFNRTPLHKGVLGN